VTVSASPVTSLSTWSFLNPLDDEAAAFFAHVHEGGWTVPRSHFGRRRRVDARAVGLFLEGNHRKLTPLRSNSGLRAKEPCVPASMVELRR